MTRYELPLGMRYATLEERAQYYKDEFDLEKAALWLKDWPSKAKFAVIIGRHTEIYPEKYREDKETTIIIDEYKTLTDVQQQILEFLPEAAYYDRNVYNESDVKIGQELAFDLDPENITCPIHGSLADKLARNQGLSFCEFELEAVKQETIKLCFYLKERFSNIKVVYSGRGFHVHVFDSEAFKLDFKQRLKIAREVKREGFMIDEWVTSGENRLIRLPFSLNGLVSRIVYPLSIDELEGFNPIKDPRCIPRFLRE